MKKEHNDTVYFIEEVFIFFYAKQKIKLQLLNKLFFKRKMPRWIRTVRILQTIARKKILAVVKTNLNWYEVAKAVLLQLSVNNH